MLISLDRTGDFCWKRTETRRLATDVAMLSPLIVHVCGLITNTRWHNEMIEAKKKKISFVKKNDYYGHYFRTVTIC